MALGVMRRRALGTLAVAMAAAWMASAWPEPPVAQQGPARRVVLVSFDGAADWIVDRMISRGKAPAFERLAREGARAEAMVSVLPTLTAPAHATLWTGATPRVHSVVGNTILRLPRSANSLLDRQSGFDHGSAVEPIWSLAVKAGHRALVLQAAATRLSDAIDERAVEFDVYSKCGPSALVEGRLPADPGQPFVIQIEDAAIEVRRVADGLEVAAGDVRARLSQEAGSRFSPPIAIGGGARALRVGLIAYDASTGAFSILRGRACEASTNRPDKLAAFRRESGTILGESVVDYYLTGRFGATLAAGGSGQAEDRLADVLEANHEFFVGGLRFAAQEPWDLLVTYVPTLDAMGHALAGILDPATMGYDPALAERMWPWLERVFERSIDGYVADVRRRFPDATLVVVSDHGMEGSARTVYPNVALREAGLLAVDSRGQLSLARTEALHIYGNGGGVFINAADRKDGIVGADRRDAVKRRVTAVLLAIRDPATGASPIRAVFDAEVDGQALGIGGDAGADLYFDLAPGYDLSASIGGSEHVAAQQAGGSGDHGGAPWHRGLHAIFFAVGPGVAAGFEPGIVRAVDVAPTVADLLRLPKLPRAEGRALF